MQESYKDDQASEYESLFQEIARGAVGKVNKRLSRGLSPDCRDEKARTPLIVASEIGNTSLIGMLIGHGADKDATDVDGETGLFKAARKGDLEMASFLLSQGANPHISNNEGLTASGIAQKNGHGELAAFLLAESAKDKEMPQPDDSPAPPSAAIPVAETSETESRYSKGDSDLDTDKSVNDREDGRTAPETPTPNLVVEGPMGSRYNETASVENTQTNPIETILTFVMGMVMPGTANPRLMFDLLCQGALERFRGRTINEAAQDIQLIVLSAVSNILMFLGYYLLVVFFDKNPANAFSRNPKKQTSLNELAQQKGMPFTRQRLSECVRCAALDMELRKTGLHLDSLTYYHYAEISKLPKLKDQIALAQVAELQRLTAGEVKERVRKKLGKISSEDKIMAKAVMRNVGDILRILTDEETQNFLKDKERVKAAFEPTESTAFLGNIRKLKKNIPTAQALFTDLEPNLSDLLIEYTCQDEEVDVEVEEDSQ